MNLPHWLNAALSLYLLKRPEHSVLPGEVDLLKKWSASSDFPVQYSLDSNTDLDFLLSLAKKWHEQEQLKNYQENEVDVFKVLSTSEGFYWVLLKSENSFTREGIIMKHCVKDYFKFHKETFIYSLRDKDNKPHATIEIRELPLARKLVKTVVQISGKANTPLKFKYRKHLIEFLNHFHNSTWAYPNHQVYAANSVAFDPIQNAAVLLENLNYFSGTLDLINFTGIMPKKCFIDGNVNLTLAAPHTLSESLIITGKLTVTGSNFKIPAAWSFEEIIRL